jgi:hypothetical protein
MFVHAVVAKVMDRTLMRSSFLMALPVIRQGYCCLRHRKKFVLGGSQPGYLPGRGAA